MKRIILFMILLFLSGCVSSNFNTNKAKVVKKNNTQTILEEDDYDDEDDSKELYFAATRGKILYNKPSVNLGIEYKVQSLLKEALRKLRKRRLSIALEVSDKLKNKKKILAIAQKYILKNRKYSLANTDKESLLALKKVLKKEKDGIYKHSFNIKLRKASDVVVFITGNDNSLTAKVIAKNGAILAESSVNLKSNNGWVEVKVPRNDGPAQTFEVMIKPVSKQDYLGFGGDVAVTNVSFIEANNYCKKLNAQIIQPYVFEYARREGAIFRPVGASIEMIAPYDDEDQDVYYQEGDNLEAEDGTIIIFNWNNEKYFAVSDLFKSPQATFRCMRER